MHSKDAVAALWFRPQGDDYLTIRTESRISDHVRETLKNRDINIQEWGEEGHISLQLHVGAIVTEQGVEYFYQLLEETCLIH